MSGSYPGKDTSADPINLRAFGLMKAAYAVSDTLDLLSIGPTSLYAAVKRGDLRHVKFGKKTLFYAAELAEFLARLRRLSEAKASRVGRDRVHPKLGSNAEAAILSDMFSAIRAWSMCCNLTDYCFNGRLSCYCALLASDVACEKLFVEESMAARTIPSLIADELLSRLLTLARKRAARQGLFSGIAIALNDPIGLRLMATGMFEATQIDGVTQLLEMPGTFGLLAKPAGLFIDVGANIGLFTVAFSGYFDRTVAIEANPQTFAILQANVLLRELSGVTCLRLAASNSNDTSILFVPADGNLGGATMNPHQHQSPRTFDIECRPLDKIIEEYGGEIPVGLVKIDVEGHEFNVLQGAQKTLVRNRPVVLFEALDIPEATRCAELLVECGYTRFFSFRRGRAGSKLIAMLTGLIQGLDVYPHQINIDKIRRSPLICAIG